MTAPANPDPSAVLTADELALDFPLWLLLGG
jgi:hypothetical protein